MTDLLTLTIAAAIAAVFLGLAFYKPEAGRTLIGLVMLAGALFNAMYTFPNRETALIDMVSGISVPLYRDLAMAISTAVVVSHTGIFVALVVAFETATGILVMGRGRLVRLGLACSALWFLAMWPMAPAEGLLATAIAQIAAAVAAIAMLRRDFPAGIPSQLFTSLRGRGPSSRSSQVSSQ